MRHTHPAQTVPRSSASFLDDARWAAFVARDPAFDGHFFASVKTTGIYCRPSCPARRAKREHVRFYETAADAEAAGFRPCKRCKPNQPYSPTACREGRRGLSPDRDGRGRAQARRAGAPRWLEPLPLPSHLQIRPRRDTKGLRRRQPQQAHARCADPQRLGDRGDL